MNALPPPRTKQQYQIWKAEDERLAKKRYLETYRMVEAERLLESLDTAIARVAKHFGVTEAAVRYRYERAMKG